MGTYNIVWKLLAFFFVLCLIDTVGALRCLECNVWKAGYGHMCDNPRVRDDCYVCMKLSTTIRVGYYKNAPRVSTVVSKVCGRSKSPRFSHECFTYTAVGGESIRCYCDTDLCNDATRRTSLNSQILILLSGAAYIIGRKFA